MKILFFGDRHYMENQPSTRLDDFQKTSYEKDMEILNIAKEEDVDLIIHPGDLFHKPNISDEFFIDILSRWTSKEYANSLNLMNLNLNKKNQTLNTFIPMISVVGNHDVYGANAETLNNTKLGLMNFLGINKIVSKDKPYIINTEDGLKIAITGTNYHTNIDSPENINDYIIENKIGDYHIHLVHGMLLDKKVPDDIFKNTVIDDILKTKADITLSGHDHIGFGVIEEDNKIFCNPGAVMRLTADKKEVNRKPKVIIFEITKEYGITYKEVFLKTAKDGKKVLDREKIENKKRKDILQDQYLKKINDFKLTKKADIYSTLDLVAKNENIKEEYKDDLIDRTIKKETDMKVHSNATNEVYIQKIKMENFQSHEKTELNLSNGFNILIGESSTGKTSIIRAIRWVYENKPSGRDFIMKDKDYAMVTLYLSNNYIITRKIERKSSGFNGYIIKDPDGNISDGNTTLLTEVQKILGYNDFLIDKDLQIPINFMLQGDSWFLIGDKYSSIDRAKIIGAVKGTHYIDAVKRDLDKENKIINSNIKKEKTEVKRLNKELEDYEYLKDLKKKLDLINHKKLIIEENLAKIKYIKKKQDEIILINKNLKINNNIIDKTNKVNDIKIKVNILKASFNKKETINNIKYKIKYIYNELTKTNRILEKTKYIDSLIECLNSLKESSIKFNNINKLNKNLYQNKKNITNINYTLDRTKNINILKERKNNLLEVNNKYQKLSMIYNNINQINTDLANINNVLIKTKEISEIKLKQSQNKELANTRHRLLAHRINYNRIKKNIDSNSYIINKTSRIGDLSLKLDKINDIIYNINQINILKLKRDNIILQIQNYNNNIINYDKQKEFNKNKLLETLNNIDTCPTCLSNITEEQKNKIIESKLNL